MIRRPLSLDLAVALYARVGLLVARVGPILHHEVLHRLGLFLGGHQRARLDLPDLGLQHGLPVLHGEANNEPLPALQSLEGNQT
jgi:hypothetical protein